MLKKASVLILLVVHNTGSGDPVAAVLNGKIQLVNISPKNLLKNPCFRNMLTSDCYKNL